jgi:hypothetical protein
MDNLLHPQGREGRNVDAEAFSQAVDNFVAELGWEVVRRRTDVRKPSSGDSRGIDGLIVVRNPQSGDGEAYLRDEKRHQTAGDCGPGQLGDEVQTLRDKVAAIDRPALYSDQELGALIDCVRGGFLLHHTRGFDRALRRRVNAEAANKLKHHQLGAFPYVVYELAPDTLCGLAELFSHHPSAEFWWPPSEPGVRATWSRACPPRQLAAGWLLYRDHAGRVVLWSREDLERADARAAARFAHRAGEDIHVVACNGLTESDVRHLSDSWRLEARYAEQRRHPTIPERPIGLDIDDESMRAFERRWGGAVGRVAAANEPAMNPRGDTRHHLEVPPIRRGRLEVAYPMPPLMAKTAVAHGTLHGLLRLLAAEGVFLFAKTLDGAAGLLEETWLSPPAYRRLGRHLESSPHASILGFELTRSSDAPALPHIGEDVALDELIRRAEAARGRPVDAEHQVKLRCVGEGVEDWGVSLELVYQRLVDIEGGERIRAEVPVTLLARQLTADAVDLAVLVEQARDVQAATAWLRGALSLTQSGWIIRQHALPRTEPARFRVMRNILEELGGPGVPVRAQEQHRRDGPRDLEDRFAKGVRVGRYDTDFYDLDTVAEKAERDLLFNSRLTAYVPWRQGAEEAVLAIRARQRPKDAHLSLAWDGGRRVEPGMPSLTVWEEWQKLDSLGWSESRKRQALAGFWRTAVDVLRADAASAAETLRRSA